jgi:hypothetical protein
MVAVRTGQVHTMNQWWSMHYPNGPTELKRWIYEVVVAVVVVIAQLPRAERLRHGNGPAVAVGKVRLRPQEDRPNESMRLQSAGHNETELIRWGTELMVRKVSVPGRPMAELVGRGKWGRAWVSWE